MEQANQMKSVEVEGAVMELPYVWHEDCSQYLLTYPNLAETPAYTPDGYRLMLTFEDACPHAALEPGIYRDCGSCRHYRQAEDSLLGVCHCEALRRKAPDEQGKDDLVELEIEGLTLKIPFVWDKGCGKYVLDYPDYLKQPTYTPNGWRIMLTYEDACPHADLQTGGCQDCGSCSHYAQLDGTFLGVCHSPSMRRTGR